jgi:hypothetical protein
MRFNALVLTQSFFVSKPLGISGLDAPVCAKLHYDADGAEVASFGK